MNRATSRLPHLLLASAFAFSLGAAPALAEPPAPATTAGAVKGEAMDKDHKDVMAPKPATCAATAVDPGTLKVASDPEEGGQIARTAKPKPKPQISDINVVKTSDKASASLAPAAAGPAAGCGSTQP